MNKENFNDKPRTNGTNGTNGYYGGEYYSGQTIPDTPEQRDEIDLKHLVNVSLRYKWWVITITLLLTAFAGLYAYSLQDTYQSSGTMMIAEERNRYSWSGTDISSIISNSYGVGSGSRLVNEIQVFRSRKLASEVAAKMASQEFMSSGERFPMLWREYPEDSTRISTEALTGRIMGSLQVDRVDMDTDILRITFRSPSPEEVTYLVNTTMDTYTEVSAEQKRMAANSALTFLEEEMQQSEQRLNRSEEELQNYMERTNLVQIDAQTGSVISRIAELEAQKQQVEVNKVAVNSSIESYENQLDEIRPGLAEQFADNISSNIQRSQIRLAELEMERDLLLQRNPSLRSNPDQEPQFAQLLQDIDQTKQRVNQLAAELINDESDMFIGFLNNEDGGVTSRIVELRQQLIELRIELSQLNAQETALEQRLEEENEFFDGLPENMIELVRLRRESEVNEQLYSTISEQFTQTSLWKETQFGAGRPLDYAREPGAPAGPNRTRYIMIGFLFGGILSVGFVFVRENLNQKVDGTDKIRSAGLPVLAIIPDHKKQIEQKFGGKEFVSMDGRKVSTAWTSLINSINPVTESYRRLHNNIIYSDPDRDFKTILITSAKKGEGKTTVALNLAVALAESGKKVLVVDIDLRRPNVHKFAGESRVPGVVELFYNIEKLSDLIRPSAAPGVYILPAGKSVPNPAAVTQSGKLSELVKDVKDKYDHVIIDTPPFGVITDAASIVKMADSVVLVTRFGDTQTNELNHTMENLNRIRANVAGAVITGFEHKNSSDYYYSGKYSYDSYQAYEAYQEEDEV